MVAFRRDNFVARQLADTMIRTGGRRHQRLLPQPTGRQIV